MTQTRWFDCTGVLRFRHATWANAYDFWQASGSARRSKAWNASEKPEPSAHKNGNMVAVVLGSVLLCCAVLRAASDHPSLYLRGKELESNNQGGGFPLKTTRVPQPKPLIDDCMLLPKTPSGKDLDKKRLFRKIGGESNVDLRFLSYAKPQSDETAAETISLRRVSTEMKNYLKEVIRNETKHMAGVHKKPGSNVERFMMKWLLHKSFCPVKYKWHDMGECSWPRWLAVSTGLSRHSLIRCTHLQIVLVFIQGPIYP